MLGSKWRMNWQKGQAYSQDLRERVLATQGSIANVGERFNVSGSYVSRVRTRRDAQGVCTVHLRGGCVPMRLAVLQEHLLAQVAAAPEQALAQLCQWAAERSVQVSTVTMHKSLKRWGLTVKKTHFAAAQHRAGLAEQRTDWR